MMEPVVRRKSRKLVYEGNILKIYNDEMSFPGNKTEFWDYIHHDGAAAIVPVMDDGKIVLVSQYRSAVDGMMWEIPAGKLDGSDEDPAVCASRELEEEIGYTSERMEWLMALRTMVAFSNEKVDVYVASDLNRSRQHLDENEYLTVKAFSVREVKKMIYSGEIQDCKTIAAVLAYEDKYINE